MKAQIDPDAIPVPTTKGVLPAAKSTGAPTALDISGGTHLADSGEPRGVDPHGRPAEFCAAAAARGHIALLRWAISRGAPCNSSTVSAVAAGGHLDLLRCMWSAGFLGPDRRSHGTSHVCTPAARGGHLDVLRWMWENGVAMDECSLIEAASHGHLCILEWHDTHSAVPEPHWSPFDATLCEHAARGGHVDVVEWLHNKGLFSIKRVCLEAATEGHSDVLQWALSRATEPQSFPWSDVKECAARAGHVGLLEWCLAHGSAVRGDHLCTAIKFGRFDAVRWLFERAQMPPAGRQRVVVQAITSGELEILKWLAGRTGPGDTPRCSLDGVRAYFEAVKWGHLHIAMWLWTEGVPLSQSEREGCATAAFWWNERCVMQWLDEQLERT